MPKLMGKLPDKCLVAVSGGLDSIVALDFLSSRCSGIVHVNHSTGEYADAAEALVRELGQQYNKVVYYHKLSDKIEATENAWRNERLKFFGALKKETGLDIVCAHHLDDCVEEYIVCTMKRGFMGTIPYSNSIVVRPFLLWSKKYMEKYAEDRELRWIDDPSNRNTKYQRNYVRHILRPEIEKINPGLSKIVKRLLIGSRV